MEQKVCKYCETPAEVLSTKCISCGSALPVALPRPIAAIIEKQGHWSLRKTGFITVVFSMVLAYTNILLWESTAVIVVMMLWILLVMPAMLLVSAWMNANRKIGSLLANIFTIAGIWFVTALMIFFSIGIANSA